MSQITALISGLNQNYDYQLTALARALVNPGVISGLGVTTGSVAAGEGFILATRTNGQQIMIHYTNTAAVTIDTTGTKKVWVGISQSVIDDGSTNAVDGTGIATIQTGASYPVTGAYIPLASITSGVITDARKIISGKNVMREGLTPNCLMATDQYGVEYPSVGGGLVAVGCINAFGGSTAPAGYLLCDGSAVSRTTYAALFTVLSTTYGVGDGSTTFNLPNLKGRVPVGRDSGQTEFDVLGETGGAKTHTLAISEIPAHTHSGNFVSASNTTNGGPAYGNGGSAATQSVPSQGGGASHNNLQPYLVINYIIKT